MQKASGPQLNQIRNDFNNRVSKKSMLGKTKRVLWANSRRYSSI